MEPRLLLHGHFHVKDEAWVEQFDHRTHVVSLDCDGSPEGSLVVLTLPDHGSGAQPVVEWMAVDADQRRSALSDDQIALKAPIAQWTRYDVVGVRNNGRSAHWKALARVARRYGSTFGSLLAEALTLTSNEFGRDYVRRVLAHVDQAD